MFWNKKKSKKSVPWRDKNGNIMCPGDACPKECDKSCPIWLNTMGLKMLQLGEYDSAIRSFGDALSLASDFVDVQNNIGTAYGLNDQHQDALNAFKKALEMRPNYPKALSGLVVASKNLGKFEDATKYCNQLEMLGYDVSDLREDIQEAMEVEGEVSYDDDDSETDGDLSYVELTMELLSMGREEGLIISDAFAHIPEIMVRADETCGKIIAGISDYSEENPGEVSNPLVLMFVWSALAGMGAVYHWHIDWTNLSSNGIYETLTSERGLFAMDEYVIDAIGIGFGTDEEKELTRFLWRLATHCLVRFKSVSSPSEDSFLSCPKAMFLFGMSFEMNRLGML